MTEARGTAILVDFDGTITEQDVGVVLLEQFSRTDWRTIEEQFERDEVDIRGNMQEQFAHVPEDAETLVAYARPLVTIRSGWEEFVAYCRERGLGLAVVSGGLDFYVEALLPRTDPTPSVHALRTEHTADGWRVALPHDLVDEGGVGYKEAIVERYRRWYREAWFVGNGVSDRGAARVADRVWAVEPLLSWCGVHGITASPFETFHDLSAQFAALLDAEGAA